MSVIDNERTKLFANALDRASTACVTVGVFTPLAGFIYNFGGMRDQFTTPIAAFGFVGWLFAAVTLHFLARRTLKGLVQ